MRTHVGARVACVYFPLPGPAYLPVFRPTASHVQALLQLLLGLLTLAASSGSSSHPLRELRSLAEQDPLQGRLCLPSSPHTFTSEWDTRIPTFLL